MIYQKDYTCLHYNITHVSLIYFTQSQSIAYSLEKNRLVQTFTMVRFKCNV